MRIAAVLFDLDGVLVDACEWHYEALNQALLEICNTQISREDHDKIFNGLPTRTKYRMLVEQRGLDPNLEGLVSQAKQKHTMRLLENLEHDSGKVEMLVYLKMRGLKIGCVTNSVRESAETMLINTGQHPFIDVLISNEDVSEPKPSPEGYERAMYLLNVTPEQTLIVEDSIKGIQAAVATGAAVLVVKNATEVTVDRVLETLQ